VSSLYLVNVGQWRSGPAKEGVDELGLLFDNVEGFVRATGGRLGWAQHAQTQAAIRR
jgi:hypothetical protein